MHASGRSQAHEVNVLAVVLGIRECFLHFGIVVNRTVLYRLVNLHQVLIKNTAGANVLVTYFRVTHLTVGQTHIFTAGFQL